MIFPFPYSNLYNLNLDWMIKTMKEMQAIVEPLDRVVNSVNNMTGDVTITKAFLLQILESMVSKFNGRAGDVTLTAADVNSTMIDITWTSDPGDVIGDLAQNVRDQLYAIGKRVLIFVNNQGVPDQIYFLTLVGDVVTPQIYSPTAALAGVASFNGQTGNVTATGSNLDTANDNDTPISESIENLQDAVGEQSQHIVNLGNAIAYVENGDIATNTYSAGRFILWKGTLYTVNSEGIAAETAIAGHVTAVTGGGFNALNDGLNLLNSRLTSTIQNEAGSFESISVAINTIAIGMNVNTNRFGNFLVGATRYSYWIFQSGVNYYTGICRSYNNNNMYLIVKNAGTVLQKTFVPYEDIPNATQSASGLMSTTDKTKLDGIQSGAQANPGNATQSASGLMSATDKTKLDGIKSGANIIKLHSGIYTFTNGSRQLNVKTITGENIKCVLNVLSPNNETFTFTVSDENSSSYTINIKDTASPTLSSDLPLLLIYVPA